MGAIRAIKALSADSEEWMVQGKWVGSIRLK